MLRCKREVLEEIVRQARQDLPHETCGYLAERDGIVEAAYPLTNTDKAADHFSMDPAEQFAAVKAMRARRQTPRAVYHSHPETPARPSAEDIRLAYDPSVSYVILSFAQPGALEIKSFRIRAGRVTPEEIVLLDADPGAASQPFMEETMQTTITPDAVKDCRNVGCPMNMVYAKVELAKLQSGQVLEIILDNGPPITNVSGSVSKEGHTILDKHRLEDGAWSLLIRKK